MELIFKRPTNKPPCICILFTNTFHASKVNSNFVEDFNANKYSVTFEIIENKLDVILRLNERTAGWYRNVKFYSDKLTKFLHDTKNISEFSFCHIIEIQEKHIVVNTQPGLKLWVLKVDTVKLVREE